MTPKKHYCQTCHDGKPHYDRPKYTCKSCHADHFGGEPDESDGHDDGDEYEDGWVYEDDYDDGESKGEEVGKGKGARKGKGKAKGLSKKPWKNWPQAEW